jgi:phosphoglycerate dehydrogenase-like enzyme
MAGAILVSEEVAEAAGERLRELAPARPVVILRDDVSPAALAGVDVAYFSADLFPDRTRVLAKALHQVQNLSWFHSFSAGVDHPWFQRLLAEGARVTTSSGASAVAIAQTALLYILALSRDLPGWQRDQHARHWNPRDVEDVSGQRLLVVGLGPIGLELARLGAALGMEVRGLRRTPRGDEPCETWPLERLDEALPRTDWLALALPLVPETTHLIDARRLALLPRTARLLNVGRGALVDEAALVAALEGGRLSGAGLDVFEVEPLPEASALWSLPNVIVTPHAAGTNPGNALRATEIFLDNLARLERGDPLRNEVELSG